MSNLSHLDALEAEAIYLLEGNNNEKSLLIPHKLVVPHGTARKGAIR